MSGRIQRNLIDLVTGTFVSRVLGFLRELVTAAYYGTNRAMDLFVIAFTIPTFFRHFLGEDVVERAFLPPFKRLISQKKYQHGWQLLSSCFNLMVIALIIVTAILYLIAPLIVKIIAPGLEPSVFPKAITMTYWILPFMLIIGLSAFVGSVLNFFEMNKIYSLAPAMLSIGVIIGVHYFRPFLGIYALPAGFLLGGLLELIIQIPFLFKRQIWKDTHASYSPTLHLNESEMRTVSRESGFILLKSLLDKSVEIVDRMLASFLITGSIASLWYAQRLIQLPVAIIGLSISRALVPYLTEKKALVQDEDFLAGIRLGIQMNLALVLPIIMIMVAMATPIISLVYQRGHFDAESTRLTAIAFWCYSVGLLGISLNTFFSRLFSIFQKNKMPFYIAIATAILNIILNFILVKTPLKHGGIALASSIAFSLSCLLLFYFLSKELRHQIDYRAILRDLFIISLVCFIIGIMIFLGYHHLLKHYLEGKIDSLLIRNVVGLGIGATVAGLLYLSAMRLIGPKEIRARINKAFF
ncbi:MAG: murein biosynthesis integral membrane protein MurJ [candidate division KSB1 bacterium]|nr:murein biosynthesis integral membrane protein MurJ [candidate division KSB1 bacterium]